MQNISEKLQKYIPAGKYNLAALVEMVFSTISDPQSSQADWDAGRMLNPDISTTSTQVLQPDTTSSVAVISTDRFTAASPDRLAYLMFTDGSNVDENYLLGINTAGPGG
jgi:hypothetical protein